MSVRLSGRECIGEGRKGYMDWEGGGYSVSEAVRQDEGKGV